MQKLFIFTFVILICACGAFAETDIKDRIEYLKQRIEFAEDDIKEWKKELKSLQSRGVFSKYTSKRGNIRESDDEVQRKRRGNCISGENGRENLHNLQFARSRRNEKRKNNNY